MGCDHPNRARSDAGERNIVPVYGCERKYTGRPSSRQAPLAMQLGGPGADVTPRALGYRALVVPAPAVTVCNAKAVWSGAIRAKSASCASGAAAKCRRMRPGVPATGPLMSEARIARPSRPQIGEVAPHVGAEPPPRGDHAVVVGSPSLSSMRSCAASQAITRPPPRRGSRGGNRDRRGRRRCRRCC
jgi:hypothetical protein